MNCLDARGRLDRFLDGELDMGENVEIVRHLETCAGCSSIFEGERALFDEVRRTAAGPSAPAGLRDRIGHALAGARAPASRPWPFARALVPAAAAALLIAVFASVFAIRVDAQSIAQRAVRWHDARLGSLVPVSDVSDLDKYFGGQGQKACLHERIVKAEMNYAYQSACVEMSGPAGETPTCWWIAGCPKSGCRMTHACFKAPEGLEKVWPPGEKRRFVIGDRTVWMGHRNGIVCLFVFDNPSEADRFAKATAKP